MASPVTDGPSGAVSSSAGSSGAAGIPELPADATAEQKDLHWYRHVYQGDKMPQLTLRAVLMGGFLGMMMSAANLYTSLSIGWGFGIAITASVLSFVIWNFVVLTSGGRVSQMSVLENACMASCASAAGYSTGSTIATMFGALVLLQDPLPGQTTADIKTWEVVGATPVIVTLFTLCTGLMGVFLAIPMKRQMINHEQLPFPSGIAAAETLKSLYSQSAAALKKAYVLVTGLAAGLIIGLLRAGDDVLEKITWLKSAFTATGDLVRIPSEIPMKLINGLYPNMPRKMGEVAAAQPAGFAFEPSALLIAAGMIVGMRTSVSLILGSTILYCGVAPYLAEMDAKVIQGPAIKAFDEAWAKAKADTAGAEAAVLKAMEAKVTVELAGAAKASNAPAPTAEAIATAAKAAAAKLTAEEVGKMAEARQHELAAAAAAAAAKEAATKADYKPALKYDWAGGEIVLRTWALWGGTATMVFASLASVALQWKTLVRAFTGGGKSEGTANESAAMAKIEVPGVWMIMGMVPITIAMVWLQIQAFNVSWYAGVIAVVMSFVLSLVASRATGETDTTPIGAMGKVMQLAFAGLAPSNITANLASAGIAANSASSSADLLTDLKTGYLLGANPRKQFLAQFFGVFFGTVAIVPIWFLMVPTKEKLEKFGLPSTRAWEAVARVLVKGVKELPPSAITAIFIGAAVGCILPVMERLLPKYRKYMPSATGMGLAWVLSFQNSLSFLVGALIALAWVKLHKKSADDYNVPVASGLVAGESLMSAALAIIATVIGLIHG